VGVRVPRRRHLGAAATLAVVVLVAGCSSAPVEIPTPDLDRADQAACDGFVADLPSTLDDEERVETTPASPLGAAYGDPALVVRCGVEVPAAFELTGQCEEVDDVGWWAPPEQYDDQDADVTLFLVGYAPAVELQVPSDYRPDGVAAALGGLAGPVKGSMEKIRECV